MKQGPSRAAIAAGVAALVVCVVAVVVVVVLSRGNGPGETVVQERKTQQYSLESGSIEKRLYTGDSILVSVGNNKYVVEVADLGQELKLSTPGGNSIFELGQEGAVDLSGDGVSDIRVFVADLFKNDPSKGVSLRLEVLEGAAASGLASVQQAADPAAVSAEAAPAETVPAATVSASGPIIFSSASPYPFTLQATFKGYCMFRWEPDRKEREERYFHKAEVLNIQAQNGIRLWLSNASAVKLVAIGGGRTVDLELGGSGEVVVSDVKWVKDEEGRFKLTTVRLD